MDKTPRSKHIIGSRFQLLADHVYGPYPDHILLEEELKPKPSSDNFLDMHCVTLYADDKLTGLDHTEYINNPPKESFLHEDNQKHVAVSFCGTVKIQLAWLTKQGRSYLERDVRKHDRAIFPHNRDRDNREISLEQVLNGAKRDQSFKIYLLCQKTKIAGYLTSSGERRQHELLIYSGSADVFRKFAVKSLHAETFAASKTFLARYRLRALLVELNKIDKETPISLKDHNWVVQNYISHILPRDSEDERRLKLRGGSQSALNDDLLYPKHPRHVPRSQIYSELAEHCDWILANQIAKTASTTGVQKTLIFIPSWVEWCHEAYAASFEAKQGGVKWGMSAAVDVKNLKRNTPQSLPQRLAKFGESENFWKSQLKNWVKHSKEYVEKHQKELSLLSQRRQPSPFKSGGYNPDPNFSTGNKTSEWADSDGGDFSGQKDLLKEVSFCAQPPQIPLGSFVWSCPGQYCHQEIDLLSITPQDIVLLPPDLVHVLKTKEWKTHDAPIQQALAIMVSHHYQHAHLAGFLQNAQTNEPQVSPPKALQRHKRVCSLDIKEEDSS